MTNILIAATVAGILMGGQMETATKNYQNTSGAATSQTASASRTSRKTL